MAGHGGESGNRLRQRRRQRHVVVPAHRSDSPKRVSVSGDVAGIGEKVGAVFARRSAGTSRQAAAHEPHFLRVKP